MGREYTPVSTPRKTLVHCRGDAKLKVSLAVADLEGVRGVNESGLGREGNVTVNKSLGERSANPSSAVCDVDCVRCILIGSCYGG